MVKKLLIFAAGVGVGVFGSYFYFEKKFQKEISEKKALDEERAKWAEERKESVDEEPTDIPEEEEEEVVPRKAKVTQKPLKDLAKDTMEEIIQENGYSSPATQENKTDPDEIEIIAPEEFGNQGYSEIELTYYADGTLADDEDDPMDSAEIIEMVGPYAISNIGKFVDDAVHVRNNAKQIDFEILRDERNYEDVVRPRRPGRSS